jgi:hypothetical protein
MEMEICRRARWIIKTLACCETGRSGATRLLVGEEDVVAGDDDAALVTDDSRNTSTPFTLLTRTFLLPPPTPLFSFIFWLVNKSQLMQ